MGHKRTSQRTNRVHNRQRRPTHLYSDMGVLHAVSVSLCVIHSEGCPRIAAVYSAVAPPACCACHSTARTLATTRPSACAAVVRGRCRVATGHSTCALPWWHPLSRGCRGGWRRCRRRLGGGFPALRLLDAVAPQRGGHPRRRLRGQGGCVHIIARQAGRGRSGHRSVPGLSAGRGRVRRLW